MDRAVVVKVLKIVLVRPGMFVVLLLGSCVKESVALKVKYAQMENVVRKAKNGREVFVAKQKRFASIPSENQLVQKYHIVAPQQK